MENKSYLVDVLAIELRQELRQAVVIGLNTDGVEDALDVLGGWRGVSTEAEEEVSSEMLHFACGIYGGKELKC